MPQGSDRDHQGTYRHASPLIPAAHTRCFYFHRTYRVHYESRRKDTARDCGNRDQETANDNECNDDSRFHQCLTPFPIR